MMFDEATSALDTETEKNVQKAIDEVSQGSTALIIAHRLSTVRDCDKIIVLKYGAIVEEGSHDELLEMDGGYYKRLWNQQSEQDLRRMREIADKKAAEEALKEAYAAKKVKTTA